MDGMSGRKTDEGKAATMAESKSGKKRKQGKENGKKQEDSIYACVCVSVLH